MGLIATVTNKIIPNRIIFKGQNKKIIRLSDKFTITSYNLHFTKDETLKKVVLNNPHPNSNPETNEFCLSFDLKGRKIDHTILPTIEVLLRTFNLDDCYFQPWQDFYWEDEYDE